jgi:hypothetical protein
VCNCCCVHCMVEGDLVDVLEEHAASIFKVEACRLMLF